METNRIVRNAKMWNRKPIKVLNVRCDSPEKWTRHNEYAVALDYLESEDGEETFMDIKERNYDLKDYVWDFNHLSKKGVSSKVYQKCKEAVRDATKYEVALVIQYDFKGKKKIYKFSYSEILRLLATSETNS